MRTHFIEAQSDEGNWGKFMLGVFDKDEWAHKSQVDDESLDRRYKRGLLTQVGWGMQTVLVLDLQTGEGAIMRPGGHASNDLNQKHKIWVCPLFEPFLNWLWEAWNEYAAEPRLPAVEEWIEGLPEIVHLTGVPLQLYGYRRAGKPTHDD